MAVPPHGYLPYNKAIPHGGETALMLAARVGDMDSAKLRCGGRSQRERYGCMGSQRHGSRRSLRFSGARRVLSRQRRRSERGCRRLHCASRGDHAAGRKNGRCASRSRRRPECSFEDLDAHAAFLGGLAFRALIGWGDAVLVGGPLPGTRRDATAGGTWRRSKVRVPRDMDRVPGVPGSRSGRRRRPPSWRLRALAATTATGTRPARRRGFHHLARSGKPSPSRLSN